MSRIAKNTIKISKETSCTFEKGIFLAKGKLGEMSVSVNSNFEIKINDEDIQVIPKDNKLKKDPNWGTTRAIIANTVKGKGVKFMERNQHEWHHKQIDNKILKKIKTEIFKK